MRAVCLKHVSFEGPGALATALTARGVSLERYLVPKDGLPKDASDLLIVMGGPMWLFSLIRVAEVGWIRNNITGLDEESRRWEPVISPSGNLGYLQVFADFSGKMIVDFSMERYRRTGVQGGMMPPGMSRSFAQQLASMLAQIPKQFFPLHTAMGASSKFPPAALRASWRLRSRASLRVTRKLSISASRVLS